MTIKRLPRYDLKTKFNHSPHIVILGAGASRACCDTGDRNGRTLPLMNDLIDCVGIGEIIRESGYDPATNFEAIYRVFGSRSAAGGLVRGLRRRPDPR